MPADGKRIDVNFQTLENPTISHGVGGFSKGFNEEAVLGFSDGKHIYAYEITLEIASPTRENAPLPSLLGRDVLNRLRVVIDRTKSRITFTPHTWDLRIKLKR